MNVYKNLTDIELFEKLNNLDNAAYKEIYKRYHKFVFIYAYMLTKNEMQSRDLVQDVFIRLSTNKTQFDPSQSIASYVSTIVRNLILDQSKRNKSKLLTYINKLYYRLNEDIASIAIEPPKRLILSETPQIITDIHFVNQKILDRINRNPYEMYNLSPRQFEIMCAELYEERGYKVILTQETRDGGKDLIILDNRDIGRFKVYGECKRHTPDNPVSVNVVKQLAGNVWADKATAGIVITSSYFSPDAKEFANRFEHQLSLMDFNRLQQMMLIN